MQKIFLTTMTLFSAIHLLMAQGTVALYNTAAAFAIQTNATVAYAPGISTSTTGISPGIGPTARSANGFYYTVLIQPQIDSNTVPTSNPFDPAWSQLQTLSQTGYYATTDVRII